MLNLAAAFNRHTTTAVTHERDAEGAYVNGKWVPGATTTTTIRASIQPLSGDEFANLPSGIRSEAKDKIITRHDLKSGDRIIDGNASHKVLHIDDWQKLGGYTRAILGALR